MRKSEAIEFHEREAARLRRLLANRLAEPTKEHERLAEQLEFGSREANTDRAAAD